MHRIKQFIVIYFLFLVSSFCFSESYYNIYETKGLRLTSDNKKMVELLSEVAYIKNNEIKIIYTFNNPNSKMHLNAKLPISCTTTKKSPVSSVIPFSFFITVDGKLVEYSYEYGTKIIPGNQKYPELITNGQTIPLVFSFDVEKKSTFSIQVNYMFLECSEVLNSYEYNYYFSKDLFYTPRTKYKLYYLNPELTYYLSSQETKEFVYKSKIDSNEWCIELDTDFLDENNKLNFLFKKYPKFSDKELAFQLLQDGDLFFLTTSQLKSILDVYRLYFYQLTDLQNNNEQKIKAYDKTEYPVYMDGITPGTWIRLKQERLEKEAREAQEKAEQEAREQAEQEDKEPY